MCLYLYIKKKIIGISASIFFDIIVAVNGSLDVDGRNKPLSHNIGRLLTLICIKLNILGMKIKGCKYAE